MGKRGRVPHLHQQMKESKGYKTDYRRGGTGGETLGQMVKQYYRLSHLLPGWVGLDKTRRCN